MTDLPAPKISKTDKLLAWEQKLPLMRCSMKAFMTHLELAHEQSGNEGYVRIEDLISNFTTPAWRDLKKADSDFRKLLETNAHNSGKGIDYEFLVIMALLHCRDAAKPVEKAIALYGLLQEGGAEKHHMISASDKDWKIIIPALFKAAISVPMDNVNNGSLYS